MATNKKFHIIVTTVLVVITVLITTVVLRKHVFSINNKLKGTGNENVISIPSHESLDADDSGSYSGSNSISGSNLDSDSDFDFDFDFTKDFGVYMDLDFIHKVFGLKISSDSGSASDSGLTSKSGSQQASITRDDDWLYRQPPPDLTQIVEGKYESCTGDVFGKAVNWNRVNRYCHHIIDTNLVNSFFQTTNNIGFKHCRAHEYNENVPKSELRPCWPKSYSHLFREPFDEFVWSDTTVGNWLQDQIGFRDIPFTSYRLQCYARKSLKMSRSDMKQWYDSQSGCGDSLVGFMLQES